ncbi:hypothetical protein [Polaromonas sp.]|uniref:hypothetical protein n=1 Tax=Polaromonas sp. TaxID=1869339 RepID=UPI003264EA32
MTVASRHFLIAITLSLILASPFSLFASYAALEHNPQEEFCGFIKSPAQANYTSQGDPCTIKWSEIALVFGSWFVPQFLLFAICQVLWARRRQRRMKGDAL